MRTRFGVALVLAIWVAAYVSVRPVCAYLDPGTGSYIFQLIVGALVGGLFILKVYWKKITSIFVKNRADSDDDEL